ncbi:MAG: 16S rRNA (guanine(966)-N(2))-methyltransferase RsmD [Phycisphaerae bacterium]|nr:16S rRNA (guanine(966)-N(2))-methyltransferase RsmD [Phycisphaerae bacterium]
MRIIAGSRRGMRLFSPIGRETRPITDRVKESVFNIMMKWDLPADAVVADLFCGTGSLGLEALSRGAKWVTFVEQNRKTVEILDRNITKAGFLQSSRTICYNAFKIGAAVQEEMYDLVFVDPPYEMSRNCDIATDIYMLMKKINLQVKEGAMVLLRTHLRSLVLDLYGQLERIDKREWGDMKVSFFKKQSQEKLLEDLDKLVESDKLIQDSL